MLQGSECLQNVGNNSQTAASHNQMLNLQEICPFFLVIVYVCITQKQMFGEMGSSVLNRQYHAIRNAHSLKQSSSLTHHTTGHFEGLSAVISESS